MASNKAIDQQRPLSNIQIRFQFLRRLRLWRHKLNSTLPTTLYKIKVSIIVIHFHWLSTNEWMKPAWSAHLYSVPEGGGVGC